MCPPFGHHAGDQLAESRARAITAAERRQRQMGVEERDEIDAAFEVVIQVRELFREPATELLPDETAARDEHGQLVHRREQIHLPVRAPLVDVRLRLLLHRPGVHAQPFVAQGGQHEAHLLVQHLGRHVVDDAVG